MRSVAATLARRRTFDAARAALGLAPLPRPDLPAVVVVEPPVAAEAVAPRPAPVTPPTALDIEFEKVRTAALERIAAERAEAAEVDKAVEAILFARAAALNL